VGDRVFAKLFLPVFDGVYELGILFDYGSKSCLSGLMPRRRGDENISEWRGD